jgi:hypothetical protein
VYFDIAIIHDQIFCHKVLKSLSINYIKLAVLLEPIDHLVHSLLKLIPVLLVLLDFALCPREILIELLQIIMVVNLLELILLSNLAQLAQNILAELSSFLRELFLHIK